MDAVTLADIVEGRAYGRKTRQYTLTYIRFEFLEVPPFQVWLQALYGRQTRFRDRFNLRLGTMPFPVSAVPSEAEALPSQELAYELKPELSVPRLHIRSKLR